MSILFSLGVPIEPLDMLKNTNWTLKLFQSAPGKWGAHYTCKEIPNWNQLITFSDGEEVEVYNPLFGNKNKFAFKFNKEGYASSCEDMVSGKVETSSQFTKEGLTCNTKAAKKTDVSLVEKWTR